MNQITMKLNADHLIMEALKEDITSEDITTNAVMREACPGEVQLICKQDGVIAGLEVYKRVFELLDEKTEVEFYVKDGDVVKNKQLMGVVRGDIRVLLSGERVALNYLQRMSGIATYTRSIVDLLEGSKTRLLDTRKTTPNMRVFEKYAVKVGGGCNHRYNLSDGILLKDNHIGAAGSVAKAIEMAKEYAPFVRKIEIEVENLEMVKEAVEEAKKAAEAEAKEQEAKGQEPEDAEETEATEEEAVGKETNSEDAEEPKKKKLFEKKNKKDKKDEQIADLTDKLTRHMAEFDNYRKRTEKEKSAMYEIGAKDVVEKILPIVDNFERGLQSVSEEKKDDPFVDGMDKIYKQMMSTLEGIGVKPIEAVGQEFDPNFHNAVMHVEDEELGENVVAEEFQKGYMYRDSVVRHSMVKVAN